ncbi:MAG TPA: plastocyanin/azurin family copper-binding protein [Thermoleophilaceae bacterium]|nr:plastocyanin/azurin family copper-binding protein [Thermoleophilaceae bacterium]
MNPRARSPPPRSRRAPLPPSPPTSREAQPRASPARARRAAPPRARKVGQKVTWTNDETVDHNVTAKSGAKFMSKAFGGGGSYSYTPRAAGTIRYVCTLHPGMDGVLVVEK